MSNTTHFITAPLSRGGTISIRFMAITAISDHPNDDESCMIHVAGASDPFHIGTPRSAFFPDEQPTPSKEETTT